MRTIEDLKGKYAEDEGWLYMTVDLKSEAPQPEAKLRQFCAMLLMCSVQDLEVGHLEQDGCQVLAVVRRRPRGRSQVKGASGTHAITPVAGKGVACA